MSIANNTYFESYFGELKMPFILQIIKIFDDLDGEKERLKINLAIILEDILNSDYMLTHTLICQDIIISNDGQFHSYNFPKLYAYVESQKSVLHWLIKKAMNLNS